MRLAAIITVWSLLTGGMFYLAHDYEATPGLAADAPETWPEGSVLPRSSDSPTLVMFLHPRCPCSKASLAELEEISTRCRDRLAVVAVVATTGSDPAESGLWRTALAIPGAAVMEDDGTERRRFDVKTSGQAMLYAADGRLLYRGGITAGRGVRGENGGRSAVESLVGLSPDGLNRAEKSLHGLVFGCPLAAERNDSLTGRADVSFVDARGTDR